MSTPKLWTPERIAEAKQEVYSDLLAWADKASAHIESLQSALTAAQEQVRVAKEALRNVPFSMTIMQALRKIEECESVKETANE